MSASVIIVTGARDWTDATAIRDVLSGYPPRSVVIHGAAMGADWIAQREAFDLGHYTIGVPANWTVDGRGAEPKRNALMLRIAQGLDWPLHVHAFPGPNSKCTWHMVRIARAAGVTVTVHGPHAAEGT